MGKKKIEEKMKKLTERKLSINNKIMMLKKKDALEKRKRETRRKILIGALILEQVKKGQFSEARLKKMMESFLTRPIDRKLFDLPEIDHKKK